MYQRLKMSSSALLFNKESLGIAEHMLQELSSAGVCLDWLDTQEIPSVMLSCDGLYTKSSRDRIFFLLRKLERIIVGPARLSIAADEADPVQFVLGEQKAAEEERRRQLLREAAALLMRAEEGELAELALHRVTASMPQFVLHAV